MKNGWTFSQVALLFIAISFGSISNVQSQDLFREMDQLKREISDLKNEVSNLRNLVYDLRKSVLSPPLPRISKPLKWRLPKKRKL